MDGGLTHGHHRRLPLGQGAAQTGLRRGGAAAEGLQRRVLEGGVRFDSEMQIELVHIDRPARAGADVERQPLDLLAHQAAFAGQAGDEAIQSVLGQADLVGGQGLAGHPGHVAGLVLVAGDGDGGLRRLRRLAQGGVAAEGPGLDHQHGVRIPGAVGMSLEGGGQLFVDRGLFAAEPHPDQPAAAGHRQGGEGVLQPGLVAINVAVGQDGDVEGIVEVGRDRPAQERGALRDA